MPNPYPYPPLQVFERLQIDDGLLMTADLWQRAHGYHRQRHGFTFQSLYYPGIVYGLNVITIAAPEQVPGQYRDGRWLEIQPGVAIDVAGRPIVVPDSLSFRVELEPPPGESCWVYLTVRHVDPDTLRGNTVVRAEQFRIVEKMTLDAEDIELCRILLQSGETGGAITLRRAANVFSPIANELDLRHRPRMQPRPDGLVRLAQLTTDTPRDRAIATHLQSLLKATTSLYPRLSGYDKIDEIRNNSALLSQDTPAASPDLPDLIYASWSALQQLGAIATEPLTLVLDQGGMLLVNITDDEAELTSLYTLRQELQTALNELENDADVVTMRQQLTAELAAFEQDIAQQVQQLVNRLRSMVAPLEHDLIGDGTLSATHPLRLEPFLFSQWPLVDNAPLIVRQWDRIILIIGDITPLWGPDETMQRSRSTIRTAQEFGVNLLMFAWQHRHLIQLQGGSENSIPFSSSDSLRDRISPNTP